MNAKFYMEAGELTGYHHREDERQHANGSWYTAHVVRFEYENGWAEYDGGRWVGKIEQR